MYCVVTLRVIHGHDRNHSSSNMMMFPYPEAPNCLSSGIDVESEQASPHDSNLGIFGFRSPSVPMNLECILSVWLCHKCPQAQSYNNNNNPNTNNEGNQSKRNYIVTHPGNLLNIKIPAVNELHHAFLPHPSEVRQALASSLSEAGPPIEIRVWGLGFGV